MSVTSNTVIGWEREHGRDGLGSSLRSGTDSSAPFSGNPISSSEPSEDNGNNLHGNLDYGDSNNVGSSELDRYLDGYGDLDAHGSQPDLSEHYEGESIFDTNFPRDIWGNPVPADRGNLENVLESILIDFPLDVALAMTNSHSWRDNLRFFKEGETVYGSIKPTNLRNKNIANFTFHSGKFSRSRPTVQPLVGIEPNPGPKPKGKVVVKIVESNGKKPKKSKRKGTRTSKRGVALNNNERLRSKVLSAPVSYGMSTPGGFLRFVEAPSKAGHHGLRFIGRTIVGTIQMNGTTGNNMTWVFNNLSYLPINIPVLMANGSTTSPYYRIATSFARWRPAYLKFIFHTARATSDAGRMGFGYIQDGGQNTALTFTDMLSLSDSCSFPLWNPKCEINCEIDQENLLYVDTNGPASITLSRQTNCGAMNVFGNSVLTTAGTIVGDLWAEFMIDLYNLDVQTTVSVDITKDKAVIAHNGVVPEIPPASELKRYESISLSSSSSSNSDSLLAKKLSLVIDETALPITPYPSPRGKWVFVPDEKCGKNELP
jgi:hypothetical protein